VSETYTMEPEDGPAALAQRQLDAYNDHDLEAFAACFADDVEAFALPSMEPLFAGRDALRERYGPYFEAKRPRATLTAPRVVQATIAIDAEHVVLSDGRELGAVALYHVEGGLIRRLWFIR